MNRFITPRLAAIASLVQPGASVIDVGSDHAYIPIFLLKEKRAVCALATDVHDGPLARALSNIRQFGLMDKICVQKANGLIGVRTEIYNTVIIAGMGGMLIADILSGAGSLSGKHLILQPMTAITELRFFLSTNGFRIVREKIVQEEDKLYIVIEAESGEDAPYSDVELLLGRNNKSEPLYLVWKKEIEGKLQKKISGLCVASVRQEEEIAKLNMILRELKEW